MKSGKLFFRNLMMAGILAFSSMGMFSCQQSGSEDGKFIGLQLYSVREAMNSDVEGTVAKVGEIGYKFVEAAGYGEGKFYGMEPVAFKELCETNGLQFLGSHTGQDVPDSTNWESTMAWWDECIAAHKAAGVKWIVQPWMGGVGYESMDGLKRYCAYFDAVGEKCNAAGIRFGYHNHANEFTTELEGKPVYDWMLELTDPEKVMFQLDLYWIIEGGKEPVDYFNTYPGRFELWHIKDKEEVGASGNIDFESIFAEKEKSGFKYGIVEVEEYNFEPIVSCQKSVEWLNSQDYVKM
ncbi:sugar phosphate isomerase/epimerase family protein [Maribellus maritimus]|uniref:sugar phosphate isomerase/epimerase family protein n=1 Tax=Maribellus maritimus TaxID=2870838 RepID=UPI001EEA2E6D|nr:sugar phosphate isomerase/epimerase [Maribellus maritimus]